ncbi:MAG TPA: retron St85 family effector protein [Candidatus Acidoferrales bacterium]|nr:retron St85 family effector protein [Candidatus Acidoferrales bacterium]
MTTLFTDQSGQHLLEEIRTIFQTKPIFRKRDKHIIFVCGGRKNRRRTMRRRFLDWSKTKFPAMVPILAEDAFRPTDFYETPTGIDLARFEKIMGSIADGVVVFPESAGSYAEVGYFADRDISEKILIANSLKHQVKDSFLNLGPIRRIDTASFFRPAIQLRHRCLDFSPLKQRLERITRGNRRRRFEYKPFWQMDYKEKFLATLQLLSILQPIDLEELNVCLKVVFGDIKTQQVGHIVGILHAAGFIICDDDLFKMPPKIQPLLEIEGIEIGKIRLRVGFYYKKNRR